MDNATKRMVLLNALTKLAGTLAKDAGKPPEGQYSIEGQELVIRFHGSVTQGADYERTPTVNIPLIPALMLCLEKAGIVGPALQKMLMDAMREALNQDAKAKEAIAARMKDAEAAEAKVREGLKTLPKVPCAGPFVSKGASLEALTVTLTAAPL